MTGAIATMLSAGGAIAGTDGAVVAPTGLAWNDIYGEDSGSTKALSVTGITASIVLTASRTGGGVLGYILNGNYAPYVGAVVASPNDTLAWAISLTGSTDCSGLITVTNVSASAVLDTFSYSIYSSRGVRM